MGADGAEIMTTNVQWLDAVQALRPTGIKRHFSQPPRSLETADLPAAWPMLPSVESGQEVTFCVDSGKTRTIGYMVALNPVNQDIPSQNMKALAPIVDAVETAFDAMDIMEFIDYTIETTAEIQVGGTFYFGLNCTLTGRNA
jgi:hypothetical protein